MATVHIRIDGSQLDTMVTGYVDWGATAARICEVVAEHVAVDCGIASEQVDVEVEWDAIKDRVWVSGYVDMTEERDLTECAHNSLVDFPWWNPAEWAVWE